MSRPSRRWIWRIVFVILALAAAGVVVVALRPARELDCKTAARTATVGVAVGVCQREYERTKLPLTGAYLADVLRRSGNPDAATAIATELLATDVRADALQVLGKIATDQERPEAALQWLQEARQLHRAQGNHRELARDDLAVARVQEDQEQYADALQSLDECVAETRAAADELTEAYCHLNAARSLTRAGYFEAAHQELDRAAQQITEERELAYLWYTRGNLEQEVVRGPRHRAHDELAVAAFERSLGLATRAQLTPLLINIHLNLAFSLAEIGRTDDADRHLAEAGVMDRDKHYERQRSQLAARIAYHRGNLSLAFSLNEQVYPKISDDNDDERIDVCVMQARIALDRNDLAAAERWAKRGVDAAEKIRAAQTLSELRPWVLASRREPFEVQFTALARAGRVEDAVGVFDRWQGRTLLDEMARPSPDPSPGLASTASRIQSLGRWLPAVSRAPLMTSDGRAVIQTLGKIDLIALAVADGDVWRVIASHGRFRIDNLGAIDKLRDRLDHFVVAPTEPAIAGELGALFLPDDVVRRTDEPLYVVLDAPLAGLPFVALRRDGQPLIAARPVLRSPRLPVDSVCEARGEPGSAQVLADAAGDLPDARRESSKVASLFGTTPLVGAAATSTALFAAKSDPLLHVAVHADVDAGGGVLRLHDRAVSAPEISANKLGPALVVLSACSTASSSDPEIAGSLSTAFLAGGAQRVVATLRPVSDAGALELTSRFYDARGADDPVRVLARIQAELARGDNKEWPNFAVFGNAACGPRS